ncbi:MAG: hypothetical protein WCJ30_07085, partial [Deltaproteobacteria bacterium]
LADLIEATIDFLFRLWVGEFGRAGAPDAAAARFLVENLGDRMSLGIRVAVASRLRAVFVRDGLPTAVRGLADVEFGQPGDERVGRLVVFRNKFAHGNFGAAVRDIEDHRTLLEELLERLPALAEQPVLVEVSGGAVVDLRGVPEGVAALSAERPTAGHPFIVAHDGSVALDLFPLWLFRQRDDATFELVHPDGESSGHAVKDFFSREALREYAQRWQDEIDGLFSHDEKLAARVWRPLEADERRALREAVDSAQLVLVEGHPGCGKAAALHELLLDPAMRSRFADVSAIVLEPGEPSQRAGTFAALVARGAERALGLAPRALFAPAQSAKGAGGRGSEKANRGLSRTQLKDMSASSRAEYAAKMLAEAGLHVLVLVEDAHVGTRPASGERETVAAVVRALANTNVHVVATTHPGALWTPFAHDRKVQLAIPATPQPERLNAAVAALVADRAMLREVLASVCTKGQDHTLFAVCDALDASRTESVFEPEVERALADLRPVLTTRREGGERVWAAFHPSVAAALGTPGGAF